MQWRNALAGLYDREIDLRTRRHDGLYGGGLFRGQSGVAR